MGFSELVAGTKTTDIGVRVAMLKALYEVVSKTGANMGEASKTSICNVVDEDVDEKEGWDLRSLTSTAVLLTLVMQNHY